MLNVILMINVLFASVYIGDYGYLVLTDKLDGSWHAASDDTNLTHRTCDKCNPGTFANQSMCVLYF